MPQKMKELNNIIMQLAHALLVIINPNIKQFMQTCN